MSEPWWAGMAPEEHAEVDAELQELWGDWRPSGPGQCFDPGCGCHDLPPRSGAWADWAGDEFQPSWEEMAEMAREDASMGR